MRISEFVTQLGKNWCLLGTKIEFYVKLFCWTSWLATNSFKGRFYPNFKKEGPKRPLFVKLFKIILAPKINGFQGILEKHYIKNPWQIFLENSRIYWLKFFNNSTITPYGYWTNIFNSDHKTLKNYLYSWFMKIEKYLKNFG